MWVLWVGCAERASDPVAEPVTTVPDLPSPCLGHAWLPTASMGEVVLEEALPGLSVDVAGVEALLGLLEAEALGPVAHGVDTWLVRYRTQDRGEEVEATTAILIPRGVTGSQPVMVWEHFTTGANDTCAPGNLGAIGLTLPMAWAAKLGMIVVAPDYLGMASLGAPSEHLHPYVIGEPAAIASLDALRATIRFADDHALAIVPDPERVVLFGASQGGHAALWTDRFQAGYAPEFTVAAVVAAVPPTDVLALAEHGLEAWTPTSETLVAVSASTADWFGLELDHALLPAVAESVSEVLRTTCNVLDPAEPLDQLDQVFTRAFLAGPTAWETELPDWQCAMEANTLDRSPLPLGPAPVRVVLGETDDLAWSPATRADVERFCEEGASISLVECAGMDHEDAALATLLSDLDWIRDRLDGVPVDDACELPGPTPCTPF
jgi:hypothetical protein